MSGYAHPLYAQSLAQFGTPRELPRSGGWILERPIPGFRHRDAMGCYPVFACHDWSHLPADIEEVGQDLVSLVVVTDPFGSYDEPYLKHCFPDLVHPFKEHFVADLTLPAATFVSSHHRRNATKALKCTTIERCDQPVQVVEEWNALYANLVARHRIRGISAFSKASFEKQLQVPRMHLFRAVHAGSIVGMTLWYVQRDVAYYHLAAYSDLGYELRASFALFQHVMEYFSNTSVRWLDLGADVGAVRNGTNGLTRFKRGWASGTRTAYLCGRIFDPDMYAHLVQATGTAMCRYFPRYRAGELA